MFFISIYNLGRIVAQFLWRKVGVDLVSLPAFHIEIVEGGISLLKREVPATEGGHLQSVHCVGSTKVLRSLYAN